MVKVTAEMARAWTADGVASALEKIDYEKVAARMTDEVSNNKSKTSRNTIRLGANIAIDSEKHQVTITGSYSFPLPNLSDESNAIVREIPDPKQGELFDATTEEPETADDEEDDEE